MLLKTGNHFVGVVLIVPKTTLEMVKYSDGMNYVQIQLNIFGWKFGLKVISSKNV